MAHDERRSAIEELLGFDFVSDPRKARFPLPEPPKGHPKDKQYHHQPITFTPEQARDILKYRVIRRDRMPKAIQHDEMCANRRFLINTLMGTSRKRGLVATLKAGDWNHNTSQTAAFTWDGFLLDGQHRFAASALSGKDITLPVVTGALWDIFDDIDSVRGRSADQLLGDVKYPNHVAGIARMLLPIIEGTERQNWARQDAPNQDVINLVMGWPFFHETWGSDHSWLKEVMATRRGRLPLGPLGATVMAALAAGHQSGVSDIGFHVQEFLDGLDPDFSHEYVTIGAAGRDPRLMLRSIYLRRDKRGPDAAEKRRQVGHCRRAMEVWLEHKTGSQNISLQKLPTVSEADRLPEVWRADAVRAFHNERVC